MLSFSMYFHEHFLFILFQHFLCHLTLPTIMLNMKIGLKMINLFLNFRSFNVVEFDQLVKLLDILFKSIIIFLFLMQVH